jgi:methyl-accepting chemotaxis protein
MFFRKKTQQESFKCNVEDMQKAIAFNLFMAAYTELSAYKTENRVENINMETENLAAASQEMSAAIQQIAGSFQMVQGRQLEIEKNVAAGRNSLGSALEKLESSDKYILQLEHVVKELADKVAGISHAVELISAVTDQTHLLALNASIEAARAGEYGRGFAVVAAEIRKLANDTKTSAADIKEAIEQLGTGMAKTTSVMQDSLQAVSQGITSAQEITGPFNEIEKSIKEMSHYCGQLSGATEEQTAAVQEVAATAANIAESTAFADEIARESEIQADLSNTISTNVWESLTKQSESELQTGIVSFLNMKIVDHAKWIRNVVLFLKDKNPGGSLPDHHNCHLGKWYYGEGQSIMKTFSPEAQEQFRSIEEPHRLVHEHGILAVENHKKGNTAIAFKHVNELTNASQTIIQSFINLIDTISTGNK